MVCFRGLWAILDTPEHAQILVEWLNLAPTDALALALWESAT